METQTEYNTLKQYMTSNAGWFDKFQINGLAPGRYKMIKSLFWVHIQARNTAVQILISTFPGH